MGDEFSGSAPPGLTDNEHHLKDIELRTRTIKIERRKAAIEKLKAGIEQRKAKISVWAIGIPITLALLTLAGSIWVAYKTVAGSIQVAHETVVGQFTAKAAELALQGEGPEEIINRANFLADLYAGLLPENSLTVLKKMKPEAAGRMVIGAPWISNFQKELVALLAKYPAQREQIIADYKSLYPEYHDFLDKLPPRLQSAAETKPER